MSDHQTLPRNPALKRTLKGREDERTGRGRPAVNGIELRNLGNCRILPRVCSCLKATLVAASRRVVIGGPESKAHSREPSCQQGRVMPVQGRHPSQYAWRPGGPPDTEPGFGRICGVHATGIEPAGAGGEPGARAAHARFWEGPGIHWTWIKYCDTTRGNGWTTGKTNRILNPRDPGLLTRRRGRRRAVWKRHWPRPRDCGRYPQTLHDFS